MATSKKVLTDAEKNLQAIINKKTTGTVQATTKLIRPAPKLAPIIPKAKTAEKTGVNPLIAPSSVLTTKTPVNANAGATGAINWMEWSRVNTEGTYKEWEQETGGGKDFTVFTDESGNVLTHNEMVARGMLTEEFKKADQNYFNLYGKHLSYMPSDLESASWDQIAKAKVKELEKKQQEELDYLKRQNEIAKELDQSQLSEAQAQSKAAIEATQASLGATDREGVISTGNQMVSSQFSRQMSEQMHRMQLRVESAQMHRDKVLKDLEDAQQAQNEDLAMALGEQLARAESALSDAQSQRDMEGVNQITNTLDLLGKLHTGSLIGMDLNSMMALGIDPALAPVIQNLDVQRLNEKISDPEYITKMNQALTAGMTSEQKNFIAYQNLLKSDPASARQFAVQVGIDKSPTVGEAFDDQMRWNEYALKYYNDTGTWPSQNGTVNSDGSVVDNYEVGAKGGQCGYYVNQYYGSKIFGDSLASKMENNNSDVPVAGGAFITKYGYNLATIGQTGHVGLVTKVYSDGSFDYKDSNRHGDQLVDTGHVNANEFAQAGITGFFDPSKPTSKWKPNPNTTYIPPILPSGEGIGAVLTEKDAILAQMKAGNMTPSEYTKYRNMAKGQGWLDEFVEVQNSPKAKAISDDTAQQLNLPSAITNYQKDEIMGWRQKNDFGNETFSRMMFDPATGASGTKHDVLAKSLSLKDDLTKALALYAKMQGKYGNFLQDIKNKGKRVWSSGLTKLGFDASEELADYQELMSLAGNILVQKIKDISGVAVSEQEYQRLARYNANVDSMNDQQFVNNLTKALFDNEKFQKGQATSFGLSSTDRMNQLVRGNIQIPSTILGQESQIQPNEDPLGIMQ